MPSYIEIDKNASFPPSSNVGKMIFGITSDEQAALTDHLGNTTIIGGGSGMQIPVPMISLTSNTNSIGVKFSDYGFDFTQNNPEIFLFRWRNKRKSQIKDGLGTVIGKRIRPSGWVHPSTDGSDIKWEGWKFFNGEHKYIKPHGYTGTITGRVTEWSIPSTIKPYEEFAIDFNRYMFWSVFANDGSSINFDTNVFDGSYGTFSPISHNDGTNTIYLGGLRGIRGNVVKYSLAVGVDNPDATKTNGLCPKIFGAFSEPFYSIIENNMGLPNPYYNIMLVKYNHKNHTHVVT